MFWDRKKEKSISEATIRKALGEPDWLLGVRLTPEGGVTMVLQADPAAMELAETRRIEAEARILSLTGVSDVKTVLTAERAADDPHPKSIPTTPSPQRVRKGARLSDTALQQGQPETRGQISDIPGISRILVVASAKGGVGKSTVSVNLAAAFAKQGLRVGLLDADIYGPSIPTMLGVADADPKTHMNGKLEPIAAHGLRSLSIGYLTDADAPMIWRGPIVQSAIRQMLQDANWGTVENPLDLLIIDTPPGTGEAQLTLAQSVPVTAAIIVTTPQEVALADIRRGAAMFAKTHVPVIGVVETMSWFETLPGDKHYPFGQGGGARMAQDIGLPLLAEIPLIPAIREGCDRGTPAMLVDAEAERLFYALARRVALELDAVQTKPAPRIIFE